MNHFYSFVFKCIIIANFTALIWGTVINKYYF